MQMPTAGQGQALPKNTQFPPATVKGGWGLVRLQAITAEVSKSGGAKSPAVNPKYSQKHGLCDASARSPALLRTLTTSGV